MVKKEIKITELDMDFLVLQALVQEESGEVFTDFGKGLVHGYLNSDIKRTIPVVLKSEYDKLLAQLDKPKPRKKYTKQVKVNKSWWKK